MASKLTAAFLTGAARLLGRARAHGRDLLEGALDIIAPEFCRHCEAPIDRGGAASAVARCPTCDPAFCPAFCSRCVAAIRWCSATWRHAPGSRPAFDLAAAGGVHFGALRTAVLRFKFHRDLAVLPLLVEALRRASQFPGVAESLRHAEAIVPVPSHPLRRWGRGWDPVGDLAREVAPGLATGPLPVSSLLRKVRRTALQVELRGEERRENLKGAFRFAPSGLEPLRPTRLRLAKRGRPSDVPQSIVLLDDVLTTGTTGSECALELKRAGVGRVTLLAVARS